MDARKMILSHEALKSRIPICTIMGVNVAAINMEWLLQFTIQNVRALSGDYVCVTNVHSTVTAYRNDGYRMIQNGGILAIPDGGPLSSVGRNRGFKNMARTAGPSYMEEIFRISARYQWKHFFYGSTEKTLQKMRKHLNERYPEVEVVGMYSPPFRPETEEEDLQVMETINREKPDFIWVFLGVPKQEMWMAAHQWKVHGLMVGVGAAADYFAGNIKRAPLWMQTHNLEWAYRLIQDPRRLFSRYWSTNLPFIWNAMIRGK